MNHKREVGNGVPLRPITLCFVFILLVIYKNLSYRRDSAGRQSLRHSTLQGYSRSMNLLPTQKPIRDFLLMINANLHPVSHRFQVIADYWSNLRFGQGVPLSNPKLRTMNFGFKKLETWLYRMVGKVFDIMNGWGVAQECVGRTDRHTDRHTDRTVVTLRGIKTRAKTD